MTDSTKPNYKDTLNLPKTDFDMRAGLLSKEPALQAKWRSEDLYRQIREARDGAERFILHDGPPYANGNIHMGQALNKVLKDIVVRYKTMAGYDAPYLPGWDCHGQPIEQKIVEQFGEEMERMSAMEIRRHCQSYADKFINVQREQFQRLGVIGDFGNPYVTMSPQYEAAVLEVFARLLQQGAVYRQLKPVHWSIANRTALADAELEYEDREDLSIYVNFALLDEVGRLPHKDGDALALMIWTTTPWTLPANRAVAVHPKLEYSCVHAETSDGPMTFLIAAARMEAVIKLLREKRSDWLKDYEVLNVLTGAQLLEAGLRYRHPLVEDSLCPIVPAEYVTVEDGTGLVHTAPGHGLEDYGTALKEDLPVYCPVREDGTFDDTTPDWLTGLSVWEGNGKVVEHLRRSGALVLEETITHSYPHDWRSKTPTIFRATEQWFVAIDRPLAEGGQSLRDLAIEACSRGESEDGVSFIPAWGRSRILGMLTSRPDWCISRQRAWGLPIPAFFKTDGEPLLTPASVRAVAKVIAREGSEVWFTFSPKQLLADYDPSDDADLQDPDGFDPAELTAGMDTFDVWFESGSSWYAAAMASRLVDDVPVDLYLEGSDQHRGWFQVSLLLALANRGTPPFRAVLTHGFVVNEQGFKMSKSLGNAVDVVEQLEKRGADILRLWAASQNYQDDIRCSDGLIAQAEDGYRKIRNTLRFCMGACFDFDPNTNAQDPADHSIDRWMRLELHRLIRDVREAYDRYEFHRAIRMIYEFCTVQASSVYLSAVKDRLYCESPDAVRRRASQTVIHETLTALIELLAPVLPHTCDEAWDYIPNRPADAPHSVHLAGLPEFDEEILDLADDFRPVNPDLAQFSTDVLETGPAWVWNRLLELRSAGLTKLESLRNSGVKNPLDAEAVVRVAKGAPGAVKFIRTYVRELEDLLGVGYARVEETAELSPDDPFEIDVLDARQRYPRCARSWRRRPDVGSDANHPDLCARDAAVIRELRGA